MRRATFFGCTVVLVLVLGLAPPSSPGAAEGPGDLRAGDGHPVNHPDCQATCRPVRCLSQDRRGESGELSERARSATSRPGGPAIGGPPTPPIRNHMDGRGFGVGNGGGALRTTAPWGGCSGGLPHTTRLGLHWEGWGFGVSNGGGALRTIAPWGGCFGSPPMTLAYAITGKDGDLG